MSDAQHPKPLNAEEIAAKRAAHQPDDVGICRCGQLFPCECARLFATLDAALDPRQHPEPRPPWTDANPAPGTIMWRLRNHPDTLDRDDAVLIAQRLYERVLEGPSRENPDRDALRKVRWYVETSRPGDFDAALSTPAAPSTPETPDWHARTECTESGPHYHGRQYVPAQQPAVPPDGLDVERLREALRNYDVGHRNLHLRGIASCAICDHLAALRSTPEDPQP